MKIKSLFLTAVLAVFSLASCSNEGEVDNGSATSNVSIKISVPTTNGGRAIEDLGTTTTPTFTSMVIEVMQGTTVTKSVVLDATGISAAVSTSGYTIEGVSDAATDVKIYAEGKATTIAALQNGIKEVPFYGEGTITYTAGDVNTDGHKLKKAAVTLVATAARFEVKGAMQPTVEANGVYAIDVEEIYINNYLPTYNATLPTCFTNDGAGNWETGASFATDLTKNSISGDAAKGEYYTNDHNWGVIADKCDAYQLFPAKAAGSTVADVEAALPHMIVKVKYYLTQEDFTNKANVKEGWITVRSFNLGGNLLTEMVAGNIYTIDLNDLTSAFKPNPVDPGEPVTPVDPDPEQVKIDLNVKVTVTPWVLNSITPNI